MLRRFVIALSVVSLLGAFSMTQAGAKAGVVHSKRVCGISFSSKVAQCDARVVTDAKGRPLVRPSVAGYGPSQFHSGYNLPTTVATKRTIAIVDAFSNPNVLSDLNVYNAQFGLPAIKKCRKAKQRDAEHELYLVEECPGSDLGYKRAGSVIELAVAVQQHGDVKLGKSDGSAIAGDTQRDRALQVKQGIRIITDFEL